MIGLVISSAGAHTFRFYVSPAGLRPCSRRRRASSATTTTDRELRSMACLQAPRRPLDGWKRSVHPGDLAHRLRSEWRDREPPPLGSTRRAGTLQPAAGESGAGSRARSPHSIDSFANGSAVASAADDGEPLRAVLASILGPAAGCPLP